MEFLCAFLRRPVLTSRKVGYFLRLLVLAYLRFPGYYSCFSLVVFLIMQGGDADTNGAVAGALLGCKLGSSALPPTWLKGLKHKGWLDGHITK